MVLDRLATDVQPVRNSGFEGRDSTARDLSSRLLSDPVPVPPDGERTPSLRSTTAAASAWRPASRRTNPARAAPASANATSGRSVTRALASSSRACATSIGICARSNWTSASRRHPADLVPTATHSRPLASAADPAGSGSHGAPRMPPAHTRWRLPRRTGRRRGAHRPTASRGATAVPSGSRSTRARSRVSAASDVSPRAKYTADGDKPRRCRPRGRRASPRPPRSGPGGRAGRPGGRAHHAE